MVEIPEFYCRLRNTHKFDTKNSSSKFSIKKKFGSDLGLFLKKKNEKN